MATQVQRRKGTTAQHSTFTGAQAELTVDTDKNTVVVHDGATAGGFPLARDSAVVHLTGNETIAGTKTFSSTISGNISGNAGTVTNGVYTTGDQTIGGTKTFSSNPILNAGTANGVAYLNGSKVLTTGSALTFDGTRLGVGNANPATAVEVSGDMTIRKDGGVLYFRNTGATAYPAYIQATDATSFVLSSNQNIPMVFKINDAEQMRLTSTGLGIGTSSPGARLSIGDTSTTTSNQIRLHGPASGTAGGASINVVNGTDTIFAAGNASNIIGGSYSSDGMIFWGNAALRFYGNSAERARIDSSGNLLVGTTTGGSGKLRVSGTGDGFNASYSSPSAAYFWSSNDGDSNCVEIYQGRFNKTGLTMSNNNTGTVTQIAFFQTGTQRGSITTDNSTTAYNTSSDYRLKENIQPMTGALAKVQALKPCTYNWKTDGSEGEGFIAHELAEVVPQCVTGEKDAVDAEGKPVYQGIDTSFLVATLAAAIQELKAEFDAYKASHP